MAVFRRQSSNLIDWVQFSGSNLWEAKNHTKVNTNGLEINVWYYPSNFFFPVQWINLSYATLFSDKETNGFLSKYTLDYLRHQFNFNFDLSYSKKNKTNLAASL